MMLTNTLNCAKRFLKDDSGIETVEYAVIAAIVAAVAVLAYGSGWGASIKNTLMKASSVASTPTL